MAHERDEQGQAWFLRRDGVVAETRLDVAPADAERLVRKTAYAKRARGVRLTRDEAAAVRSAKGLTFTEAVGSYGGGDEDLILGFLLSHAPGLIRQLDKLAAKMGQRIGVPSNADMGELFAWSMLAPYAERAYDNIAMRMFGHALDWEPSAEQAAQQSDWDASLEGQRAEADRLAYIAAVEAHSDPDGGPEGWSTVPPKSPHSPFTAAAQRRRAELTHALGAAYRARLQAQQNQED